MADGEPLMPAAGRVGYSCMDGGCGYCDYCMRRLDWQQPNPQPSIYCEHGKLRLEFCWLCARAGFLRGKGE